ncbi:MAG: hypothetical protein ACRDJ2_14010 [Actinomycetota bacterium]
MTSSWTDILGGSRRLAEEINQAQRERAAARVELEEAVPARHLID